jgi:phosphate acetyltransferase
MPMNAIEDLAWIENVTFDELSIGQTATLIRTLQVEDIQLFAVMSGDVNPAHVDPEYARDSRFHQVIGHGMWGGALISTVLGTQLPGPGTVYLNQSLRFSRPVGIGDMLTVSVTCKEKNDQNRHVLFDCLVINQHGQKVISGTAEVLAPGEKIRRPRVAMPQVKLSNRTDRLQQLLSKVRGLPPLALAVVHPCDAESLRGALLARDQGIATPLLVAPQARLIGLARQHGMKLEGCVLIDVPHSHAAAERAVQLVHEGQAAALMKGSLHTDELMSEVVRKDGGLRTERRVSHVFLLEVPHYPRPLLITDAAINIDPDLECKADIARNAIDLAHALGIAEPRIAILAAVETINARMPATLDASALCKMAERGQITGARLDGPLAFDNAISMAAARTKGIRSDVAGRADILLVPNLEAGNMLAKQLEYLGDALAAGIVLGAQVPIVLTSRADGAETRVASCAVAQLLVQARRRDERALAA